MKRYQKPLIEVANIGTLYMVMGGTSPSDDIQGTPDELNNSSLGAPGRTKPF